MSKARLAAFAIALLASQALAVDRFQSPTQRTTSTAAAWAASGSVSQGGDASSISQGGTASIIFNNPGAVSYDFSGGVRNVPAVFAPALAGGNNCAMSASFGGSVMGFGISGGVGYESEPCNVRQEAALLHNMGKSSAAIEHLKRHIPRIAATFEGLE